MTDTLNIRKRKIYKRRRDGQIAQGVSTSVSVSSSTTGSGTGEFNPAVLQDYAKKVDVHAPSQKALLDALSVEAGYIKYQAAALSVDNADKLGGVVAASYARRDTVNTYEYDQTINADLYVNGNIIQNGSAYETHAEHLNVQNNLMQLNVGEPGSQITGVIPGTTIPFSGIEINRGLGDPYYMGVVEGATPLLKLGKKDSLVAIAAREDVISDDFLLSWDLTNKRIVGKRLASDYWHKDNAGSSAYDWSAKNLSVYGNTKHTVGGNFNLITKSKGDVGVTGNTVAWRTTLDFFGNENGFIEYGRGSNGANGWIALGQENTEKFRTISTGVKITGQNVIVDNSYTTPFLYKTRTDGSHAMGMVSKAGALWGFEINGNEYFEISSDGTKTTGRHDSTSLSISGSTVIDSSRNIVNVNDGTFSGRLRVYQESQLSNGAFTDPHRGVAYDLKLGGSGNGLAVRGFSRFNSDVAMGGYVGSPDYASGLTGADWRITKSGFAEFDEVEIRKGLTVYELIVARERSVNGGIITSVANGTVKSVSGDVVTLKGKYNSFVVGDRVRMQQWETGTRYFEAEVIAVSNTTITLGNYTTIGRPQANDDLVQWGHVSDTSRQNFLYQTARGSNAAYFAVMQGVNSSSLTDKQVLRIGNLGGYANDGYGIASKYGGKTYFELSNTTKSIAGWTFTENRMIKGNWEAGAIDINSADRHIQVGHSGQNRVVIFGELPDSTYGIEGRNFSNSTRYFKLSSSGNEIAGITFDHEKQTAGNVQIWKTGDIINTALGTPFAFYGNGNFSLGKGQIGYNAATNVLSFTDSVKLQWQNYTNSAIDSLQIGGTNLFLNSDVSEVNNCLIAYNNASATISTEQLFNGKKTIKIIPSASSTSSGGIGNVWTSIAGSKTYTFSCMVYSSSAFTPSYIKLLHTQVCNAGNTSNVHVDANRKYSGTVQANKWTKMYVTFDVPDETQEYWFKPFFIYFNSTTDYIYVTDFKLEKGSKATDWSIAPEDRDGNWVTTITNNTIQTTNILAENIRVKFANIDDFTFDGATGVNMDISGKITATSNETYNRIGEATIWGNDIFESYAPNHDGSIEINYFSTPDFKHTYGRSFNVYNGMQGLLLACEPGRVISGGETTIDYNESGVFVFANKFSARNAAFYKAVTMDETLLVTGLATLNGGATVTGPVSCTTNFVENGEYLYNKYAAKSHTHDYLSLSGGIVTGATTFNNTVSMQGGLRLNFVRTGSNYYCSTVSCMIVATGGNTIYLPESPGAGQVVIVKRGSTSEPLVNGNGKSIYFHSSSTVALIRLNNTYGQSAIFVWDGVYWQTIADLW